MNILMTGGTGLIGTLFIKRFPTYEYTVLTRSIERAERVLPGSVCLISSLDVLENLDAFDAVINLAGEAIADKRWNDKQKQQLCDSRWKLTEKLISLFEKSNNPPAVFLSASAVGIYGNRGDKPLCEDTSIVVADFPSQLCFTWESIARKAEAYTRCVLLRTGVVLATEGGALKKMLLPFRCYLGARLGDGKQYMPWIHGHDQVNAMHFLLLNSLIHGPVNLVAPHQCTNKEFTETLASVLKRNAFLKIPARLLKLLMGESCCLLLDSQHISPNKLTRAGFEFSYPNLSSALRQLVFKQIVKRER